MTGLPGAQSDVDTSATLLQLDMASSLEAQLSPDLRVAIGLLINRQDLVNQQASWAVTGLQVANSHVYVQGQQTYKPSAPSSPTTTIPAPTSSTSSTVIGAGGSVNFPVTPVPDAGGRPDSGVGVGPHAGRPVLPLGVRGALQLAHGGRRERSLGGSGRTGDPRGAARRGSGQHPLPGHERAAKPGRSWLSGFADLALVPVTFTPYLSQTLSWYTTLLGPPGKNGSQDWTNYSNSQFDQLVQTASQQLNPNTAAGYYSQADTNLWDEMVSLPLFAEPTVLAWSRTIGGVTATPRSDALLWFAQLWAVRAPESTSNTTPSLPGQ